uniref:Uncharacterized protein n=1 Tax=Arundo donax TaxID=35708 RepID=A0A0A9EWX7_ARUDO
MSWYQVPAMHQYSPVRPLYLFFCALDHELFHIKGMDCSLQTIWVVVCKLSH